MQRHIQTLLRFLKTITLYRAQKNLSFRQNNEPCSRCPQLPWSILGFESEAGQDLCSLCFFHVVEKHRIGMDVGWFHFSFHERVVETFSSLSSNQIRCLDTSVFPLLSEFKLEKWLIPGKSCYLNIHLSHENSIRMVNHQHLTLLLPCLAISIQGTHKMTEGRKSPALWSKLIL